MVGDDHKCFLAEAALGHPIELLAEDAVSIEQAGVTIRSPRRMQRDVRRVVTDNIVKERVFREF